MMCRTVGEKSAVVVVRGPGSATAEVSMRSRSGNMEGSVRRWSKRHKGRYVTFITAALRYGTRVCCGYDPECSQPVSRAMV